MSKKKRPEDPLFAMKMERDAALVGFISATQLANELSRELRRYMEALEGFREEKIREAEGVLIS